MIAIISDEQKEVLGRQLFDYFKSSGVETEFIPAEGRNIKPCYGCGGCTDKTYAKCVIRDDMDEIIEVMFRTEIIVFTSPVKWGSLSGNIKRILDRTAVMGDRFYHIKNGEIYKGILSAGRKVVAIGVGNNLTAGETDNFMKLIKEIGTIMGIDYMGRVTADSISDEEISLLGKEVLA